MSNDFLKKPTRINMPERIPTHPLWLQGLTGHKKRLTRIYDYQLISGRGFMASICIFSFHSTITQCFFTGFAAVSPCNTYNATKQAKHWKETIPIGPKPFSRACKFISNEYSFPIMLRLQCFVERRAASLS